MSELVLDTARSRLTVHTFAEGLMARLAHDLELTWAGLSGTLDGETAVVEAALEGLVVRGVVGKDARVDERTLSPSDQRSIVDKMRKDVFHAGPDGMLRVTATRTSATLRLPGGREVKVPLALQVAEDGATRHVTGEVKLSLSALGSAAVKGPMNAFRVKDGVMVRVDVVFRPA